MSRAVRVLRDNRLGILLSGNLLSNTGNTIHFSVTAWLLFKLTGSSAMVGLLSVAQMLPNALLTIPAGVIVDHRDRKRFLAEQQIFQMTLAFMLAALVWTHHAPAWALIATMFGMGIGNAFGGPSWISFIGTLVDPRDMLLGFSLNSVSFHTAAMIGPPLGALLLDAYGPGLAFFANGLSFGAILLALVFLHPIPVPRKPYAGLRSSLKETFAFVRRSQRIMRLLPLTTAVAMVVFAIPTILPAFSRHVLHAGAGTYGVLMGAFGAGSLGGAVALGILSSRLLRRTIMAGGVAVSAAGIVALTFARSPVSAAAAMLAVGGGQLSSMVTARTVIQLEAPPELAGRVVGLWFTAALGLSPIGGILLGLATDALGVLSAMRIAAGYAALVALATLIFARTGAGLAQPAGSLASR